MRRLFVLLALLAVACGGSTAEVDDKTATPSGEKATESDSNAAFDKLANDMLGDDERPGSFKGVLGEDDLQGKGGKSGKKKKNVH